ncbi:MAG: hypothetical protein ACFFEY_15115 [Candidatus Thorarchaeota archaeon]
MDNLNRNDLKSFIKKEIIKNVKKLRGKHHPISELVGDIPRSLKVKKIYDLSKENKYSFLLVALNYTKPPKLRYFLAVSLANNSSDLLVQLARDFAVKSDLKLIQYSIFSKISRIQLLLLKEIKVINDYTHSITNLKNYRREFRTKLAKINKLVENN